MPQLVATFKRTWIKRGCKHVLWVDNYHQKVTAKISYLHMATNFIKSVNATDHIEDANSHNKPFYKVIEKVGLKTVA